MLLSRPVRASPNRTVGLFHDWSLLAVALLLGGFVLFVATLAGGWR